jgi:hypothetical protein
MAKEAVNQVILFPLRTPRHDIVDSLMVNMLLEVQALQG